MDQVILEGIVGLVLAIQEDNLAVLYIQSIQAAITVSVIQEVLVSLDMEDLVELVVAIPAEIGQFPVIMGLADMEVV